ncbi:MAG: hypothetical protein V3V34_11645 [Kiloniellales bacterium]
MDQKSRTAAALEMVEMYNTLTDLETQKKQVYQAWRDRIKDAKGRVSHAAEMLQKGLKAVTVNVEERYDAEAGEATIYRLDTGEIVETRPMTEDELEAARQLELPEGEDDEGDDE